MKLQTISDLHKEFHPYLEIKNAGDADVLLLGGDICVVDDLVSESYKADYYRKFFENISKEFNEIYYVLGNHEHYSGIFNKTAESLKLNLKPWPNIRVLDDEFVDLNENLRLIGTSLWTDMNREDPITIHASEQFMNDYRSTLFKDGDNYRHMVPQDTINAHRKSLEFIKLATESWDNDVIVLGHHGVSRQSIHPRYENQYVLNGAFMSELDDFILSQEKFKLWIQGHTHHSFDYMIGGCRIICNPHGYKNENPSFNPHLVVEL